MADTSDYRDAQDAQKTPDAQRTSVARRVGGYLWLSQIAMFGPMAVCCLITPSVISSEGGVSNFGNHWSTVALYSVSFLGNAWFIYRAAECCRVASVQLLVTRGLKSISALTIFVYVSTFPRRFSYSFSRVHDYLGIALFGLYFLLSLWIVSQKRRTIPWVLMAIETCGLMIGLLSVLKFIHLLFVGQVVGGVGFGFLLCLGLPKVLVSSEDLSC